MSNKKKKQRMEDEEDMLNEKRRKQYRKTRNRSPWDNWEDEPDNNDEIYDDSYLYDFYDDEDDINQITNINDWIKNN
jgi:hypothetical protein